MNQHANRLNLPCLATLLLGVVGVSLGGFATQTNRQQSAHPPIVEKRDGISSNQEDDSADIRSIVPDLVIPELKSGPAQPGTRIKEVVPEFADTRVYHVTYLPVDWESGKRYPVIVEYAGNGIYQNQYGDQCTGLVEDCKLGFGISAGRGFIWVCLPFLNNEGSENARQWWGDPERYDPQPTIKYCKKAVPMICETYGGDPDRVLLTGFSRGAIACNVIGLHDDEIAGLWKGFVPFSHYEGVSNFGLPGLDRDSALMRLNRIGHRPQFICAESGPGKHAVEATKAYLESTGVQGNFTFQSTGFRNHNDAWILRPSPARDELRKWVQAVLK